MKTLTESERIAQWARWYEAAQPDYKPHALHAVLRNDGAKMLAEVTGKLGLTIEKLMEDMNT